MREKPQELIQCERCGVEPADPQSRVCDTCYGEMWAEQREWEQQMDEIERAEQEEEIDF